MIFLCKIYGISSANGRYPCLWYLTKESDIQYNQGSQPERTLASLSTNYQRFMEFGKGEKKNASCYNCIHQPMLDIPLDRVISPYPHCLLGITIQNDISLCLRMLQIKSIVWFYLTDDATKTNEIETFKQYGGNYVTVTKKTPN
ncbi:hypothetical protein PoB_006869700 [Plakobranchus ocellatus]|uniref:Uncharacterized protein n=1 Tax=Plakobranchus ocellatus TaxID=259542 RepID=A0AAV4DD57_9GAST|nr:hypothetical protein PoB_006869700 [Plakobranchus ocellatus]